MRDNHCVGWGMGEHPLPLVGVDDVAEALAALERAVRDSGIRRVFFTDLLELLAAELVAADRWADAERCILDADRTGGYVRIFLENADEATSRLFAQAMADVFGPVADARYVIQRQADFEYSESRFKGTWLLEKTPESISRFIEKRTQVTKRRRAVVKVHAVPKILARNKDRALIFQKNWNLHVSPGSVWFYTHEGTKSMLQEAGEKDWLPDSIVHQKEVFL